MVFDLTAPVRYQVKTLRNPNRLVVDLKQVSLKASLSDFDLKRTPVRRVRSAVHKGDRLRVVLDLVEAVSFRSFALPPVEQYGHRLVIDLWPGRPAPVKPVRQDDRQANQPIDVVVAIDAGHGGDDPGAVGHGGVYEKNVVLAIARQLQLLFDQEQGFSTKMIRTGDYYVALDRRKELAREGAAKAEIFLSIHADSFKNARARGVSLYAVSLAGATSEKAKWLADKENRADLIGGTVSLHDKSLDVKKTLMDLSMDKNLEFSLALGDYVLKSLSKVTRLHKNRVEQAGFRVLKSPDVTSILIETGYISNPTEAKMLASRAYQRKIARAIFGGVRDYVIAMPPQDSWFAAARRGPGRIHTIKPGDTLSEIARLYRVSSARLKAANGLRSDTILVGQKLKIPPG